MKKILFYFFIILFLSSLVSASSFIMPSKYEFEYNPNEILTLTFKVGGSKNFIYTINEGLTSTEIIDEKELSSTEKEITIRVIMPSEITTPGKVRVMSVSAEEEAPLKNSGISARTKVIAPVYVSVLYPGVYLSETFNIKDININETINLKYVVKNLGTENVNSADLKIEIINEDKIIETFDLGNKNIKSKGTTIFEKKWDTKGIPAGKYEAKAILSYDNEVLETIKDFKIGSLNVYILDFSNELIAGKINKFEIVIESEWNDEIKGIYGTLEFRGEEYKTVSSSLKSWETKSLEGFADLTNINPGNYEAIARIYYQSKMTEKIQVLTVISDVPSEGFKLNETSFMIIIAILIIIINVIIYIKIKRKNDKYKI